MNIVLTGGSKGIGLALTKELLEDKKNSIKVISRSRGGLEALQSLYGKDRLQIIEFDLSELDKYDRLFNSINENDSAIDVLINNAGFLIYKPFSEISYEELLLSHKVNAMGPFLLIQGLFPRFSEKAQVLNISSIGGMQGTVKFAGLSAYSSSKASLNCLTEMLAEEFKNTGIYFNCLALGSVQTKMFETAFPGIKASAKPQQMARFIVDFLKNSRGIIAGKIIPLSISNP